MIDDDDQLMKWHLSLSQSENALILFDLIARSLCFRRAFMSIVIIISCLSRWSYCDMLVNSLLWEFMYSWRYFVSYYQSFFICVSFEGSTSSLHAWISLKCLNCSSSLIARRYLNTLTINSKVFKRIIKFVSRLFVHIFFRSSSNFEFFNSVWCIVCFRASHKHFENSIAFILWR